MTESQERGRPRRAKRPTLTDARMKILSALARLGALTIAQVAAEVGRGTSSTRIHLHLLRRRGLVQVGDVRHDGPVIAGKLRETVGAPWTLTEAGEKLAGQIEE